MWITIRAAYLGMVHHYNLAFPTQLLGNLVHLLRVLDRYKFAIGFAFLVRKKQSTGDSSTATIDHQLQKERKITIS